MRITEIKHEKTSQRRTMGRLKIKEFGQVFRDEAEVSLVHSWYVTCIHAKPVELNGKATHTHMYNE